MSTRADTRHRPPTCGSSYGTYRCLRFAGHDGPHTALKTETPIIEWTESEANK